MLRSNEYAKALTKALGVPLDNVIWTEVVVERDELVEIVVRIQATPKVLADAAFLLAQEEGKHGL